MRRWEKIHIIKNVGSSWFSLAFNIVVGVFLSPFILHRLGDAAYGIWVLIFSVTGYYGLFDLGIRSSVVRYVSRFSAIKDDDSLSKLINTSLLTYTVIGLVTLGVTLAGMSSVTSWFRIPPEFRETSRVLFLMVGASVALGFPLGVFSGILEGLQRFYFLNLTNVVSTLFRAVLIVLALNRGYGLLMVAAITIVLPILISLLRAAIVLRILPRRYGFRYVDRASLREIAGYSSTTFLIMISFKLRFKTDELVIGTLLSSAAITYFSIGDRLLDYASEVVSSLAQIFVPMSSQSDAVGDLPRLQKIFIAGNRACALIIFPISAILALLGKSVITVWVGAQYVPVSYPVMLVLLFPMTASLAQSASSRILFGMAKHRTLSLIVFLEAIANLVLSILLIRPLGLVGDALGTAIPLTCTALVFYPRHMCRLLGMQVGNFASQTFLLPLTLCAPLVATLIAMRYWFFPRGYLQLALQLVIAAAVYGAGVLWAFRTKRLWKVELRAQPATALADDALSTD
jgi:O-antigen/teichoic acid export membrane protein